MFLGYKTNESADITMATDNGSEVRLGGTITCDDKAGAHKQKERNNRT